MKGSQISELATTAIPVGTEGHPTLPLASSSITTSSQHDPTTISTPCNESKSISTRNQQSQLQPQQSSPISIDKNGSPTISETSKDTIPETHCQLKAMMLFRRVGQFMIRLWGFVRSISRGTWIRLAVLALIVASLFIAIAVLQKFGAIQAMFKWINSIGYVGLLMIVALLQLTALPVSTLYSLICISSGFLYGIWIGSAACFGGVTLAATHGFLISRYLCRGWVQKRVQERPLFQNIDDIIGKEGFKLLFFIRFLPLPFGWVNSVMAATKMRFYVYIFASMLGLAPEMVALVYVGTTIKTLSDAFSDGNGKGLSPAQIAVLVVQIVAAVACLIVCTLIGRKALLKIRAMKQGKLEEVTPTEEDTTNSTSKDSDMMNISLHPLTESDLTTTDSSTTTSIFQQSSSITTSLSNTPMDVNHSYLGGGSNSLPIEIVIDNNHWEFEAAASQQNSRRNSVYESATLPELNDTASSTTS
jgi:uncharacterized membrane protein YdjX (TVP38/TMEM64 family)